ncbi:MAG: HPr(Ser) kinase/phosphatase [Malacoplasma sp.]
MTWKNIVEEFNYKVINSGEEREIKSSRITRTGLEFSGFSSHKVFRAIILWGKEEFEYLNQFNLDEKISKITFIFSSKPPLLIVSRSFKIEHWLLTLAKQFEVTILETELSSSEITTTTNLFLINNLTACKTIHGNLVEIYGKGVLILGSSGIGKSEVSMELIKKGHMFVADDAVDCANIFNKIIAKPNIVSQDFMEVRGLGIINIPRLFGIEKTKSSTEVNVIIEIVELKNDTYEFERLGKEISYKEILGVKIPYYLIPINYGRKTSDLIEVIVANLKLNESGYNSFKDFIKKTQ